MKPSTILPPLARSLSQRRTLVIYIIVFFLILFSLGLLHPDVRSESAEHLSRFKDWGHDQALNLFDGLEDERWASKVKGWLELEDGGYVKEKKECRGWDPQVDEAMDPEGCLKAKQYRQTMRVLAREELGKHDRWWFTRDHNLDTLRNMTRCFLPVIDPEFMPCPEKPLIISGWWYTAETITGATTGEVIWQSSVVKQLKQLGYYYLAVGPYVNWVTVAEMMPDVYHLLWNSDLDTVTCVTDPRCVAKEHYMPPEGAEDLSIGVSDEERGVIPIWALNIVDYWGSRPLDIANVNYWWNHTERGEWSYHPLGQEWIATPWPLPGGHYHLPYSIEDECLKAPLIPHDERKNAALLFAKKSSYFHYKNPYFPPSAFWTNLSHNPSYDLLCTAKEEEGKPLPDGLESMGYQTKEEYTTLVGSVRALVGMGAPPISPSVYTALCQGTPVVLPIFTEDARMDGWHLYGSSSQHGPAVALGEPYVYKYYSKNYTQLEEAVERAMSSDIGRFIPHDMKITYAISQLSKYLSRDLRKMFEGVLISNGGRVSRLAKETRERCYELRRCSAPLGPGRRPAMSRLRDASTDGKEQETSTATVRARSELARDEKGDERPAKQFEYRPSRRTHHANSTGSNLSESRRRTYDAVAYGRGQTWG
ncbi:hypothetical protein I317_06749 [Kwoniella heveanensis CBS 569]|nr:hypothetical protein I317_06749 [Kwoniella heveanensis CBS 569]